MKKIIDPKHAARNLDQCLGKVRDYLDKNPVQQDIYAEYENLNAWMPVTCLYSLIEQSFKVLKDLRGNSADIPPQYRHNLSHLFDLLKSGDKNFIRESYKEFQSLHNYITIQDKPLASVDEFLEQMGSDYTSWRYIPNEGSEGVKGKVSVYAMIEIVSAAIDILMRETVGSNQVRPTIERRLLDPILRITNLLDHGRRADIYAWSGKYGGYLNALSHLARYDNYWLMLVAYLELLGEFLLDGMEKDGERNADERKKICKIIDKIERITHRLSLPQCEDYKPLLVDIRQSLKTVRDRLTKESMISDGEFRDWYCQSIECLDKIAAFHSKTYYESFFTSLGLCLHPMTMECLKKRIRSILVDRKICIVYGLDGKLNDRSYCLDKSQDREIFLSRACIDELPLVWNDEKRIFENKEFVYAEA